MEAINDKIKRFLAVSSGYGSGYGYGDGSGSGDGDGYGYGDGDGYGSGSGYGDGYGYGSGYGSGSGDGDGDGDGYGSGDGDGYGSGSGYGDGIKKFNGYDVYMIDNVSTIIYRIHGNIAQGAIVQKDMTLKPCYIAKEGDYFAHGDTARQAMQDAHAKYMQNMPAEERIEEFMKAHPKYLELYPATDLFEWHNILTGSCRMGREQFCRENNIDIEKDSFTVEDFVKLTANSYGGETIKKLKDSYPTS